MTIQKCHSEFDAAHQCTSENCSSVLCCALCLSKLLVNVDIFAIKIFRIPFNLQVHKSQLSLSGACCCHHCLMDVGCSVIRRCFAELPCHQVLNGALLNE